jgi:hypothetical protein
MLSSVVISRATSRSSSRTRRTSATSSFHSTGPHYRFPSPTRSSPMTQPQPPDPPPLPPKSVTCGWHPEPESERCSGTVTGAGRGSDPMTQIAPCRSNTSPHLMTRVRGRVRIAPWRRATGGRAFAVPGGADWKHPPSRSSPICPSLPGARGPRSVLRGRCSPVSSSRHMALTSAGSARSQTSSAPRAVAATRFPLRRPGGPLPGPASAPAAAGRHPARPRCRPAPPG